MEARSSHGPAGGIGRSRRGRSGGFPGLPACAPNRIPDDRAGLLLHLPQDAQPQILPFLNHTAGKIEAKMLVTGVDAGTEKLSQLAAELRERFTGIYLENDTPEGLGPFLSGRSRWLAVKTFINLGYRCQGKPARKAA